jgi:hypothetical protein
MYIMDAGRGGKEAYIPPIDLGEGGTKIGKKRQYIKY